MKKLSRKESLLVICKISELFVDTLTADEKYTLLNRDKLTQPTQMQLSKKQKLFSKFFSVFLKPRSNFEPFEKSVTLIAYVFPKLRTRKNVVR